MSKLLEFTEAARTYAATALVCGAFSAVAYTEEPHTYDHSRIDPMEEMIKACDVPILNEYAQHHEVLRTLEDSPHLQSSKETKADLRSALYSMSTSQEFVSAQDTCDQKTAAYQRHQEHERKLPMYAFFGGALMGLGIAFWMRR